MQKIDLYKKEILEKLTSVTNLNDFTELKNSVLGRKGGLADLFSGLSKLTESERPEYGRALNLLREELNNVFNEKALDFKETEKTEFIDVTKNGYPERSGNIHPLNLAYREILDVFTSMGFAVVEGPEIEDDFHNFEGLNFPADHPARDTQDSFFLDNGMLLRTHTSPVQVRVMESQRPPFAVVSPGKCYRKDDMDATHSMMFNQIEGFLVDTNIGVADLKGTIEIFTQKVFTTDVKTRFRPHFFPFTEPSMEVDVSCIFCKGSGCSICKKTGWLEIMGAGIIHPNVFVKTGIDPEHYTGFAFGMGVERIFMLKSGVNDLRLFYENDIDFLRQFKP